MRAASLALLFCAAALPARADLRPEWEIGAGATVFTLPDYRGSDESRAYLLPFPYVVYRGDRLRVDRQGARGMLFESDRVELDLSVSATPPVDSSTRRRSWNRLRRASGTPPPNRTQSDLDRALELLGAWAGSPTCPAP